MTKIIFILAFLLTTTLSSCCQNFFGTHNAQGVIQYGYLYNWWVVDLTAGDTIAAIGWHVPTQVEFETLSTYLGGNTISGGKLKETGITHWTTPNTDATNEVGFNGRGGGIRGNNGLWYYYTQTFEMWASSPSTASGGVGVLLQYNSASMSFGVYTFKESGYSIRLLKDATTLSDGETGTYTGNDGKVYRTICIGTQEWLADNLCETKYRNGDWITGYDSGVYTPISDAAWAALTTEAMCAYNDDESNAIY